MSEPLTLEMLDNLFEDILNQKGMFAPPPPPWNVHLRPEDRGHYVHACACSMDGLAARLPRASVCMSCGFLIRFYGTEEGK